VKHDRKKQEDERIPNLSEKETLILELLLGKTSAGMYGLELVRESGARLKRGTVYVTLNRMEEKGFVESWNEEQQPNTAGLPRRLYRISGYGQRVYRVHQQARAAWNMLTLGMGSPS